MENMYLACCIRQARILDRLLPCDGIPLYIDSFISCILGSRIQHCHDRRGQDDPFYRGDVLMDHLEQDSSSFNRRIQHIPDGVREDMGEW